MFSLVEIARKRRQTKVLMGIFAAMVLFVGYSLIELLIVARNQGRGDLVQLAWVSLGIVAVSLIGGEYLLRRYLKVLNEAERDLNAAIKDVEDIASDGA